MVATRCIFCGKATYGEPVEHIVPEGLIGEPDVTESSGHGDAVVTKLTLCDDEVCQACNHGPLAKLDSYLQKQLGLFKILLNRHGTKRGAPASVVRPGLYGHNKAGAVYFAVNAESAPITLASGAIVHPNKDHPEGVSLNDLTVDPSGAASFKISQPTRMNRRFCRALYKIGFETLCKAKGPEHVLAQEFDQVREYILRGSGERLIAFPKGVDASLLGRFNIQLVMVPEASGWLAEVALGVPFYLDLTSSSSILGANKRAGLAAEGFVLWSDAHGGHPV